MHRALQIQEVFNNVLNEFGGSSKDANERECATLARLAQVGRAFLESSLDALWRYQGSILPLLKTLPVDSWVDDYKFSFRRPLVAEDWSRYDYYAKRMKLLKIHSEVIALDAFSVLEICHYTRARPLLENLSHLECSLRFGRRTCPLYTVVPFLGPSLSELDIRMSVDRESNMATHQLITSLQYLTPSLTFFEIRFAPHSIISAICQVVSSLEKFRTLIIHNIPVTPRYIASLACVGRLRKLEITLATATPQSDPFVLPTTPFPSLETLTLSVEHISMATNFIHTFLPTSSLQVFRVNFNFSPNTEDIKLFILSMCSHFSPSALRQMNILPSDDDYSRSHPDSRKPIVEAQTIRRLFSFHQLEVLNFTIYASYEEIDDKLVEEMASAWSRLKLLELMPRGDELNESVRLTIQGLLPLSRRRDLERVRVQFDATGIETWSKPVARLQHSNLRFLDADGVKFRDAEIVAEFLSDVFPNLKSLGCGWWNQSWIGIFDRYKALVKVKKQERLSASTL